MKIHSVGARFHVDRQTNRHFFSSRSNWQIGVTELIIGNPKFVITNKN